MHDDFSPSSLDSAVARYLQTLERLLEIREAMLRPALDQAAQLLSEVLVADKIDVFLLEPETQTLVALGVSSTPMGRHQRAIGLDRQSLANGGSTASTFVSGQSRYTGHAEEDKEELAAVTGVLGVRSLMSVPIVVGPGARGVLQAADAHPDHFSEPDFRFLEAIAHWVGVIIERAELTERIGSQAAEQGRQAAAEELIEDLAHDLRHYLTPLRLRVETTLFRVQQAQRADDIRDLTIALEQIDRLTNVIRDLLDTSRIREGLFALNKERTELTALVRAEVETLATPAVDVQVQAMGPIEVMADPERLRQAVENLLVNALNYAAGKPVSVEVNYEKRTDGLWAVVTIADQGPGIPPELQSRLFERFASGAESKGLGLGLYLVRRIAEAHGGQLSLDQDYQDGARFRLAIPDGIDTAL